MQKDPAKRKSRRPSFKRNLLRTEVLRERARDADPALSFSAEMEPSRVVIQPPDHEFGLQLWLNVLAIWPYVCARHWGYSIHSENIPIDLSTSTI
jgi:hypothetical protein